MTPADRRRLVKKGDIVWGLVIAAVIALFIVPATAKVVLALTADHAYLMGFAKFAILATMGELLVIRMAKGRWEIRKGLWAKALVWGVVGILVVLMFTLFNTGVQGAAAKGLLFTGEGWVRTLLVAFWTSAIMNLTFGPVFMGAHRISDAWIEAKLQSGKTPEGRLPKVGIATAVDNVDWKRFLNFVIARTIPLFWIPAHTVCFLLPPEYRVVAAAFLSIALGVILTWGKRGKKAA